MGSDRENKTLRQDIRFVLGRVAWRLAQVALVTASAIVLFNVISTGAGDTEEEQHYLASMKRDLRTLVVVQETYIADNGRYDPSPGWTSSALRLTGDTTDGSAVIGEATATGWRATATHSGTRYRCGVFGGDMAPPRKGAAPGIPICWKP